MVCCWVKFVFRTPVHSDNFTDQYMHKKKQPFFEICADLTKFSFRMYLNKFHFFIKVNDLEPETLVIVFYFNIVLYMQEILHRIEPFLYEWTSKYR